jgi:hypothetical protein
MKMTTARMADSQVGRVLRIAAVLIILTAAAYAIAPFSLSSSNPITPGPVDCGSAVIGAWRADTLPSGWFGYSPLTSVPAFADCRGESRHRLELSFVGLALGVGAAFAAGVRERLANAR